MLRWFAASASSGCAWGLLAFLLMDSQINEAIVGAVTSAPVIGCVMGRLSKGFGASTFGRRSLLAVGTLYLAVAMFGAVGGVLDSLYPSQTAMQPPEWLLAKPLEWIFALVFGVTASGYVLVLAPLAYANHLLVDAVAWD